MAQSQRVLSGSRTRGSTATPSGSIIYSYQGIYAKSDASFFGSLLPRIGSGNRLKLYKGSKPVSDTVFDDSISMNNDTADMPGGEDAPLTVRVSFDLESTNLGQAPTTQQGEKFVDINGFNPIAYLEDPGNIMWPVNLWNVGTLPEHAFDGVIEPLDIKAEILGLSGKYSGHKVRGAIMGSFADSERGGRKIRDVRRLTANPPQPFFDGPNQVRSSKRRPGGEAWMTGSVPVSARLAQTSLSASAWTDPTSVLPLQSYQGLYDEVEAPFVEKDYQNVVYSRLDQHNPIDFLDLNAGTSALYDLTSPWKTTSGKTYFSESSLVGWWRMNTDVGSSGDMADSSNNSYTGSFYNSNSRPTQDTTTYPGYPDINIVTFADPACEDFDGSANYMYVGGGNAGTATPEWNTLIGGSTASNTLKPWTFSCWIYQEVQSSGQNPRLMAVGKGGNTKGAIRIFILGNNQRIYARRAGESSANYDYAYSSTDAIAINTWHHVVVTYNGTFDGSTEQFEIYVDGENVKQVENGWNDANNAPIDIDGNYLTIGGWNTSFNATPNSPFNGKISDVAMWNTALSLDQVETLYHIAAEGMKSASPSWVPTQNNMDKALRALNKSVEGSTDPLDAQSNHGFYFGKKAGSIVYGDW